jgi:hypothetical protein
VGGGVSGFSVVREESLEATDRMGADALEDVAEVGEGMDLKPFAGADEAGEDRGRSPGAIASEEEPVLASDGASP